MTEQDWKPIPFDSKNQVTGGKIIQKNKTGLEEPQPLNPITRTTMSGNVVKDGDTQPLSSNVQGDPAVKRHTSVSFNIPPQNLSQLYHRHSISNKLGQQVSKSNNGDTPMPQSVYPKLKAPKREENADAKLNSTNTNLDDSAPLTLGDNDCTVHMPGDFIYIKPEDHAEPSLPLQEQNNKPKVSNKIVFNKDEYSPTSDMEFFSHEQDEDDSKFHILIGATGSVATIKIPLIIDKLFKIYSHDTISIQLILTKPAEHFLNGLKISRDVKIWREDDMKLRLCDFNNAVQTGMGSASGDKTPISSQPLLFHELSRWADIFLIAPLSANSLAKLANGICNNLITSVVRDWNTKKTPIVVAPAMNTFMYINPMTKKHLLMLKEDFPTLEILKPVEKVLICGDIGMGGMREWNDIVENIRLKIKEIHRQRHENEADNEDQELQEIDKDLAEKEEDEDDESEDDEENSDKSDEDDGINEDADDDEDTEDDTDDDGDDEDDDD